MPALRPAEERFWEKVKKSAKGCWLWKASCGSHGYGQISVNLKPVTTHTFSYELHFGAIPKGKWVLHTCDNHACVRPEHLVLGTQQDNIEDMFRKGRGWFQRNPQAAVARGHANRKFLPAHTGEACGASKLTVKKVKAIRLLLAKGQTKTAIAARFGVTRGCIRFIAIGHTWREV